MTTDQIKIVEEYFRTGKHNGKKVKNLFTFAREIGTSVSCIQLFVVNKNKKIYGNK